MAILKLTPSCQDYLWGGSRLRTDFGIKSDLEPLAEAWVLSCHPDGPSYLPDGTTLADYAAAHPEALGTDCAKFEQFPILTKFIDASSNLSIQVHPSNDYALKNEHQYGKSEMWYVLDCVPGAYLYYGFTHEISKEEFAERIKNNTLTEVLNAVPVHKGDCFFIPSGTLHAICQGIVVAEVQQNSNVTYRVYDYGRVGADGKPRALHIEKALDVTRRTPPQKHDFGSHLAQCEYFTVDVKKGAFDGVADEKSFVSLLITDGALERIAQACGGDLRKAANAVELLFSAGRQPDGTVHLTLADATQLTQVWAVETGSLKGKSRTYYGFSWANQPVIEQWARRVRQDMPLLDGKNDKTALKEVIAASLDGKIYFLDLEDGSKTREPIELGYPMRSTPSLSTLAYPQMSVGQYARFLANKTGSIGQHFYDLLTNKENLTIDGLDGGSKKDRAYNDVGAFDGSALYDRNSDTYITAGTNGMLYTVHMNTVYETPTDESGNLKVSPTITMMKSRTKKQKDAYTAVEAPIAMYGSYVFYADVEGVLRCVDTTTMTTVWAVETGDAVKSAVALDFDDDGRLWLYTANTLLNRSKGDVTIRRYDATTGTEDWSLALNATKKKDYTAGAMASPVIGQYQLGDLVYYTLSYISASGSEKLLGSGVKAQEGVLVALNKQTGKVVWAKSLGGYCYSSPVAVYNENGKGWIIQATSDGVLMLLDGLTGETINTLQLNGTIEASPAVYQNMLVIGTTGKGTSFLYGVKID